ncbi:hypothetical protein CLOM_g15264 [Closterium sp. NIES-68]|nr:hypothetical protein CLOM_g22813 [Closterium sp. NIES-68]GJP71277.1 hypothetical protein CLOP_g2126 [Closterium sp. NIES-67]GJP41138.1 hypothetical protein CLOM_g822 [Closterium sp. NIES-68]GJP56207.1 hypothetical protein CLOM_g15263 [Closterium sp. NIES-68]GJP56208.1 hypothetical protein CLOM_g15264 [Closterium sp. NIES-68]
MATNFVRAFSLLVVSLLSLTLAADAARPFCRFDGKLVVSNLMRELRAANNYTTFLDGLRKTELNKDLPDLFHCYEATVFAPTDAAFANLSSDAKSSLGERKVLREVLLMHFVKGKATNAALVGLKEGQQLKTAADSCKARLVKVSPAGDKPVQVKAEVGADEASVVAADVISLRVVQVHGVDDVILPKSLIKGDDDSLKPRKCTAWAT